MWAPQSKRAASLSDISSAMVITGAVINSAAVRPRSGLAADCRVALFMADLLLSPSGHTLVYSTGRNFDARHEKQSDRRAVCHDTPLPEVKEVGGPGNSGTTPGGPDVRIRPPAVPHRTHG